MVWIEICVSRKAIPSLKQSNKLLIMTKRVWLRELTAEEVDEVHRLAASRTEPVRIVRRVRVIAQMVDDADLVASAAGLRAGYKSDASGPAWVRRFNEKGLSGLRDRPRSGRRPAIGKGKTH